MRTSRSTRFEPRQAVCPECGSYYTQDEPWKSMCWPCYRDAHPERYGPAARRHTLPPPASNFDAEMQHLQSENLRLRKDCENLKILAQMMADQITALRTSSNAPTPFDDEMLGKLIRLCHPDKHANSQVSNEVTTWLLKQRKARK